MLQKIFSLHNAFFTAIDGTTPGNLLISHFRKIGGSLGAVLKRRETHACGLRNSFLAGQSIRVSRGMHLPRDIYTHYKVSPTYTTQSLGNGEKKWIWLWDNWFYGGHAEQGSRPLPEAQWPRLEEQNTVVDPEIYNIISFFLLNAV